MKTAATRTKVAVTELEGSVLGMVGTKEPCTPYAIRREFQKSPSQYWRASSGSVYPLILRLKRRRLIRVKGRTRDGRGGSLFGLTPAGQRVLRHWLGTLDAPATISVPPDPLRNRIAFFAMLDSKTQRKYLVRAVDGMRAYLARVRAYTEREKRAEQSRTNEYLVSEGAQRMLETRLEWMLEVIRVLERKAP
jgi:DNA-binding PadR family transcriptional regulator